AWLREFVDVKADDRRLADALTMAGIAVESVSGEGEGAVFETEITTNRVDAMNHYGIARECAALYDLDLKPLAPKLPAAKGKTTFPIEIAEPELCRRFTGRVLRNVKVVPSPPQVARRLELAGSHSISNAVDATNYTLLQMGKPTHAFDLDTLQGGRIMVRRARDGEKLRTLDGVERKLTSEDLVVADGARPVALAGVMGGYDTMITAKTRHVVIESAWWDPLTVRKMGRRHGLHTDASHRFERGADFDSTLLSTNLVAAFILETGGGELEGEIIDVLGKPLERPAARLRQTEIRRMLGIEIPAAEIERLLRRLGFGLTTAQGGWTVILPSWRLDVEREIDLIEEIARVYGYERFPNTLPAFSGAVVELPHAAHDARVRSAMLALGYHAAISMTFISHADAKTFSSEPAVELANPLSEEAAVMRNSLAPLMLDMVAHNLNRGRDDVRLFETGHVFAASGSATDERNVLAFAATSSALDTAAGGDVLSRFRSFKGDMEALLGIFQHSALYFDAQAGSYYHRGRSARAVMDGTTVARFGQVHPDVAAARKLRSDVFLAEVQLERLYRGPLGHARHQSLPRFPAVERDFSFVFGDDVSYDRIRSAVEALKLAELRSFAPAEIFRGGAVPAGKYSALLRATFQASDRTLRDEEVNAWARQIIQTLERLGGSLRA
ncbi:MAG: phenylalanine--tRNA ligase subunit beta, partial [Terriglobales bacterium]